MLRRDGESVRQNHDAGVIDPGAKQGLDREAAAAQVVFDLLLVEGMRALVGELKTLIADVEFGDVALLGELDAFFVRKLKEPPKQAARARGPAMMKTVNAALLLAVAKVEVILSAERLDCLLQDGLGFAGILLIRRNGRCGTGGSCAGSLRARLGRSGLGRSRLRRLRRRRARISRRLGPGRTDQNQN